MADKPLALRIIAHVIAIVGWLIFVAFVLLSVLLIGFVAYTQASKAGLSETVWYVGKIVLGLVVIFGAFGVWVTACEYSGWTKR